MIKVGRDGGTVSGSLQAIQSLDEEVSDGCCSDPHEVHTATLIASFFVFSNGGSFEPQLVQYVESISRGCVQYKHVLRVLSMTEGDTIMGLYSVLV